MRRDDGVCYEQCHNDAEEHPERKCDVSICVPVKPLQDRDETGRDDPDRPAPSPQHSPADRRSVPSSPGDWRKPARMPIVSWERGREAVPCRSDVERRGV